MSAVTTSTLSTTALAAEWLVARIGEEAAQRANIVGNVWYEELVDKQSMVAHFRSLAPITGSDTATEGAALTQLSWSQTPVLVTAALEGFSVLLSKVVNSIQPEDLTKIAMQGGNRLARDMDSSLTALFPSLTAGTVGTSGAALTVDHVITAIANLDAAFADVSGPYKGFLHPHQIGNLRSNIKSLNYGIAMLAVDAKGLEVLTIEGVEFRKNALVGKINSAADFGGAIFAEEALGIAMAQLPQVEIMPVPGYHSYSVDCTVAFGTGVIRPTFGCLVQSGVNAQ